MSFPEPDTDSFDVTNSGGRGDPDDASDDAVSFSGIQAWLDPSWDTIATDATAWNKVYVMP